MSRQEVQEINIPTTVIEMANISITGNVVPPQWFKNITFENGKPDTNSILILSDIVYWYRPTEIRCERSGSVIGQKKKFSEDMLRRSYADLEEQFGLSKKQCRDCLIRLENLGVIRRILRNVQFPTGMRNNVLYIEIIPSVLKQLTHQNLEPLDTFEKSTPSNFKVTPSLHQSYQGDDIEVNRVVTQKLPAGDRDVTTIRTNTTSEITSKISLSPSEPIFENPELSSALDERENDSLSEKMLSIWNNTLPEKKSEHASKQLHKNLEQALKQQLEGSLVNWKVVCENFKSSKFLMGEAEKVSMKPSLSWLVDPHKAFVARVFAKEQWVFDDRVCYSKPNIELKTVQAEIEASQEPIQAKEVRHLVSQENIGFYQSYFLKARFALEEGTLLLKASSAFAGDKISETFSGRIQSYLQKKHNMNFEVQYA